MRSTGAHNTVRIDGTDQFELWRSFRVGRRANVHAVKAHSEADYDSVTGQHDGYRLVGIQHRRTIYNLRIGGWLVVDSLAGTGWHAVESLIHLDPGVRPDVRGDAVALEPGAWSVVLVAMPDITALADLYSPRLGVRLASTTLAARAYQKLPLCWKYWIVPYPRTAIAWSREGEGQLRLSTPAGQTDLDPQVIASY